jgi:hypothetical protein
MSNHINRRYIPGYNTYSAFNRGENNYLQLSQSQKSIPGYTFQNKATFH